MTYRGQVEALTAKLSVVEAERHLLAAELEVARGAAAEGRDRAQLMARLEERRKELLALRAEHDAQTVANRGLRERIRQLVEEAEMRALGDKASGSTEQPGTIGIPKSLVIGALGMIWLVVAFVVLASTVGR